MWLRRKQSPFEDLGLPKNCFVSHSYKDAADCQQLLSLLPKSIKPFVFPPITVRPDKMVSDDLVAAILGCEGLIYLEGGHSAQSFWVAFERDYALRAGKKVFAYDPSRQSLRQDTSMPMHLPIIALSVEPDDENVFRITRFMRTERHFDILFDNNDLDRENWREASDSALNQTFHSGGLFIQFWNEPRSLGPGHRLVHSDTGYEIQDENDVWVNTDVLDPPSNAEIWPRRSRNAAQTDGLSNVQRLDGLIVCLYWLIYRNTHQNQLS